MSKITTQLPHFNATVIGNQNHSLSKQVFSANHLKQFHHRGNLFPDTSSFKHQRFIYAINIYLLYLINISCSRNRNRFALKVNLI